MTKVSVIIAAHNAGAFIHHAIESALAQTHADLEVIVTDDGSADNTSAIVQAYATADPRVILLRHEHCRGPSAARNTAIDHATGEWLAILDADDMFRPNRLEELLREATDRQLDVIADMLEKFDFDTRESLGLAFDPEWFSEPDPIDLAFILERHWPGKTVHTAFATIKPMVRRAFLQTHGLSYDPAIWMGEDLLFYAELILSGAKFGLSGRPLYLYCRRAQSMSFGLKPTSQVIQVNRMIGLKAKQKGLFSEQLRRLLKERERSLWGQNFVWNIKRKMIGPAALSALHLPPQEFAQIAWRWSKKKVGWAGADLPIASGSGKN